MHDTDATGPDLPNRHTAPRCAQCAQGAVVTFPVLMVLLVAIQAALIGAVLFGGSL